MDPRPGPQRPPWPHHLLAYVLSLPERLLRVLAVLLGTVLFAVTRLLPRPLREGRLYRLVVERQIRMLTDDLGGAGLFPGIAPTDARTATRLAVGGAVDNVLMIGLHASPLWVLLAATDVSRGARSFLGELGQELKARGVMRPGSRLDSLDDVLHGLASLSERLADTVDMPPLSLSDARKTLATLREQIHGVGRTALVEGADLEGLAARVGEVARQAEHSPLETVGALALGTLRSAGNVLEGGVVGAEVTARFLGRVVWRDVVGDYRRTLDRIVRRGFYGSLRSFLRPSLASWPRLFAWRFLSLTEVVLSLGRWRRSPWRIGAAVANPSAG